MSDASDTVIGSDELLRALYELIAYADNSCSEPPDFMRGMTFMFDALAGKLDGIDGVDRRPGPEPTAAAHPPAPRPG